MRCGDAGDHVRAKLAVENKKAAPKRHQAEVNDSKQVVYGRLTPPIVGLIVATKPDGLLPSVTNKSVLFFPQAC